MEITVLDIQILKALHREVKEIPNLIAEMTTPYKALQQATKWLDQQEACQLLNISKRTLQTYRQRAFLEQRKLIGKRISDYPKWK